MKKVRKVWRRVWEKICGAGRKVWEGVRAVDYWRWVFYILVFGVAGWGFETVAIIVTDGELMVRGPLFVGAEIGGTGLYWVWGMPILVMYGMGALILMDMVKVFRGLNLAPWKMFLPAVVILTVFELAVSYVAEWATGQMYWVYRGPWNFEGRISLLSSIVWGLLAVGVAKVAPGIEKWYEGIAQRKYFKPIVVVVGIYTVVCFMLRDDLWLKLLEMIRG